MFSWRFSIVVWVLSATVVDFNLVAAKALSPEEEYTRVIDERSRVIVAQLDLQDDALARRIEKIIAEQYRSLRGIHDARDTEIASLQKSAQSQTSDEDGLIEQVRQASSIKQFQLHRSFVARLSAELTPDQVNGIKDGMTYGVLPKTYAQYLRTLPSLTEDQKHNILALLIEAREYAMDAGSSDEKHGWFRKYKGKINNFLSSAGYKL